MYNEYFFIGAYIILIWILLCLLLRESEKFPDRRCYKQAQARPKDNDTFFLFMGNSDRDRSDTEANDLREN